MRWSISIHIVEGDNIASFVNLKGIKMSTVTHIVEDQN